jgi:thiosulfate/3-mercaptopyruvate sulfurtransferase
MTLPSPLVTTDWLAANLDAPDLRVLDCTVFLRAPSPGSDRRAYTQECGFAHWSEGHIPGAGFADLVHDLSDPHQRLPFMMPPPARFAALMGSYGVGDRSTVVCYDAAGTMWATRVWWMLRAFGFDNAAVLDGGWKKWTLEGRPVSTEPPRHAPAAFTARPRPGLIASKEDVLDAIENGAGCVVNALTPEQHRGDVAPYGRPGHIAASVNVSARDLVDRETGAYLPLDVLRKRCEDAGTLSAGRVITYCGGGIAATSTAFVLTLLGKEDVAVYDASLSEWARDESLPMEVGP